MYYLYVYYAPTCWEIRIAPLLKYWVVSTVLKLWEVASVHITEK